MRSIAIDRVAWSVGLSNGLWVMTVNAAEALMPFMLLTRVSPRNRLLDGVQIPTCEEANWG